LQKSGDVYKPKFFYNPFSTRVIIYSVINAVACRNQTCALRAPTAFSARINGIRAENAVMVNHKDSVGFLYEIAESARMVFIRADSAIRADGFSSAQYRRSARTAGAI